MESLTRKIAAAPHSTAEATTDHFRAREFITVNSSYILEDELRLYIIATLSLLWISAQLRRFVARDANAGCWYGWDAFALATVAFFFGQRRYAIACIFTPAYFVWTRLPGSPFNDLHLPSFSAFLDTASEQQAGGIVHQKAIMSVHITEDTPACLVCWVSDNRPLSLPCNHFMCRECLSTMKGRRQTCCPLCRRPIFHDNDGVQCAIHKAVIATFAAKLATDGIHHLLQLWHGQYWEIAQAAITYIPQFYCFRVLHIVLKTQGVEWWQFGIFDYLMPLPVPEGRFWRSVWPPVIFTLMFSIGIFGGLLRISRLDLVVERVLHQGTLQKLYAP